MLQSDSERSHFISQSFYKVSAEVNELVLDSKLLNMT